MRWTRQTGQSSVETIGVALGLAFIALVGWQAVVAAHAWQMAASAARTAARAGTVGAPVERAALAVLPDRLAKRATVRRTPLVDGRWRVTVTVSVPAVVPVLGRLGLVNGAAIEGTR